MAILSSAISKSVATTTLVAAAVFSAGFSPEKPPALPRSITLHERNFDPSQYGLSSYAEREATIVEWREALRYRPRTALGRRLMELRAQIVASGEPLLGWDDIEREVAERRGETRGE